jgi:hypothetical protein
MTYADPERRRDLIAGLRDLAALLESCPDIPAPYNLDVLVFPPDRPDQEICSEVDRIAVLLGATVDDQTASYGHYVASRGFGQTLHYRVVAIPSRARACHAAQNSYAGNVIAVMDEEG